jgi:hypothetical protein
MSDINIADYVFDEEGFLRQPAGPKKHSKQFLCMPQAWAIRVFDLSREKQSPGPVIVGMILWQKYRMQRGRQPIILTSRMLERFHLGRHFFVKWLHLLEQAGFVSLKKFKHRSPLITILNDREASEG